MRNFIRGVVTTKWAWGGWLLVATRFPWSKAWQTIDAWSNVEFILGKLHMPEGGLSFISSILALLSAPSATPIIVLIGFALILFGGYSAEKKSRQSLNKANIQGKITKVILGCKFDEGFLLIGVKVRSTTFILIRLNIVNHGPVTIRIIDWFLNVQVGNVHDIAERRDILPAMKIKIPSTPFGEGERIVSIDPLDIKLKESPMRQGDSLEGWLLFELPTLKIHNPTNSNLSICFTDSLSNKHDVIREASPFPLSGKLIWQE